MTLETWVREQLELLVPTCWQFNCPKDVEVLAVDHMQFTKGCPPLLHYPPRAEKEGYIESTSQLINYFVNQIIKLSDQCNISISCFDKASPDVKKIVCHEKRYERRCKQCQSVAPELPYGRTADASFFDPNCTKGCINDQICWFEEGPYFHNDPNHPLPVKIRNDWSKFASDSRNLLFELYPKIADALLQWEAPVGKMIYVNGLPFYTSIAQQVLFNEGFAPSSRRSEIFKDRVKLDNWPSAESARTYDTEILNRVYVFEGLVRPDGTRYTRREEVPGMYNEIHEADNAIFFFSQFFPREFRHMTFINDGDAISIGLLRALEDIKGPKSILHEHWLCLPLKSKKKQNKIAAMGVARPKFHYLNLTKMCQEIDKHPQFVEAGVQSPIATLIFLIILSGTDFFKGEFAFGIGGKGKVDEETGELNTYGIWDTFFERIKEYSHLIQYYPNVRDPTTMRTIVIDRDLWRVFAESCYTNRFGRKKGLTYKMLVKAKANAKNPKARLPDEDVIFRWSCQVEWNLLYWANAFRNIYIDPFKEFMGKSYYGYTKELKITNDVAKKREPVDEVCKRHFLKRREREGEREDEEVQIEEEAQKKKNRSDALKRVRGDV